MGVALFVSACFSCNEKEGGGGKQKEMMEANRQVMHAIETGDTATLHKYIAADATDHGAGPNGSDVKGQDIINMLAQVHTSIDNLKIEVIQEAANDDHIFCLSRMTGTTNKPLWGMPANHKVDSKSVDVVKVSDMKMVDHWAYYDMAEMMQMMNQQQPAGMADTSKMPMTDTSRH